MPGKNRTFSCKPVPDVLSGATKSTIASSNFSLVRQLQYFVQLLSCFSLLLRHKTHPRIFTGVSFAIRRKFSAVDFLLNIYTCSCLLNNDTTAEKLPDRVESPVRHCVMVLCRT